MSRTVTITEAVAQDNDFTIEHVHVKIWIQHSKCGDVQVSLTSSHGVISDLGAV